MTFYAAAALINAITSLILGTLVFLKTRKNKTTYTFCLLSLAVFVWSIFYFFWQISTTHDVALLYTRLLSIGSIFIPIFYLHWVFSFLDLKDRIANIILWGGYAITAFFLVFSFSPLFIRDVEPIMVFSFWPKAGILYSAFLIVSYLGLIGCGLYQLVKNYYLSPGLKQYQVKYIIVGTLIGFLGGASNFFLWYNIEILPVGNIVTSVYVFILFYAMVKYRLMDIRIIIRKIFVYLIVGAFTYVFFYLLIWFYNQFFGGLFTTTSYALGLIVAPLFVLIFYTIDRLARQFAYKRLFVSLYNYQETLRKLAAEMNNYIDLEKIVDLIVDTIKKTMFLNRAGVLLVNTTTKPTSYQIIKVIGFNKNNGISLVQDSFLTQHLAKTKKPLVEDELSVLARDAATEKDKNSFLRLKEQLNKIEASLCLPLIANKKLIGIIVLGSKVSGDAYTHEDLELLDTLSKQASVAIENARQYKQIQDFGKTLQGKVDEQTKDIAEKNAHLQELLAMKSDFLRVVNHQLNTPLSIMRGYFSMMKEGDYPPEKALPVIEAGLTRIINTVSAFWDAYKLEGEKMKMEPQKVDIKTIVEKMVEEKNRMEKVKERNLKITVEKPEFEIPLVWCDADKITHVVSNLLDNAVFYTFEGGINVSYELLKGFLKINVKDTGCGISEADRAKIFQKFSRGTSAPGMNPNGSGLGLYIAKKIVESNDGDLAFSSEGEGKGTTFSFTIPLFNKQKSDKDKTATKENRIEIYN